MLRIWILDGLLYLQHLNSLLNINFSQINCSFSANIHCLVHKEECGKKLTHGLLLKYWILVHFLANAVTTTRFNSNQGAWNLQPIYLLEIAHNATLSWILIFIKWTVLKYIVYFIKNNVEKNHWMYYCWNIGSWGTS